MSIRPINETDVREEVATPLLELLGYRRGSENDILREYSLAYDKVFLGRKKTNDPPLRGRADYVLSVLGAGRWVLEIKAPTEAITKDAIDQAISYARHPEVSASYAAILNGNQFLLFHSSQVSTDDAIVNIQIHSVNELAERLEGVLSPSSIRRDCSPPKIDLNKPLAHGLRSVAPVIGGEIRYTEFTWESNVPFTLEQRRDLDQTTNVMVGFRTNIIEGNVWRGEDSRIRAQLVWSVPHDELLKFAFEKKLMEVEYISLDQTISSDETHPTVFDFIGNLNISRGEEIYDILRWKSQLVNIESDMTYRGQALGSISGNMFKGAFQSEFECTFPGVPGIYIHFHAVGSFAVIVDNK